MSVRAVTKPSHSSRPAAVSLPSAHIVILAILLPVVIGSWMDGRGPDRQANAASAPPTGNVAPPTPPPALPTRNTIKAPVRPGDNLSLIFKRHGMHDRDLQLLLASGPLGNRLAAIFPGHEIEFDHDDEHNLLRLMYRPGQLETLEFQRVGDRFEGSTVMAEPDDVRRSQHAIIEHSLFAATKALGLHDRFAVRLADLFQWDIDFILDIRKGDEFHVLYNERLIDDQFIDYGDILAAEFVNQGRSYKVVRYADDSGTVGYYAPDGTSARKAFLRAPVDFTRISSNFNMQRVHPLWKSTMPHRGIDYAAPTGTRVKAASDGTVTTVSQNAASGKYIVIRHGERYQTKYLHLSRFASNLAPGKRVQQGQTIGYVGATGWATGPHLHYEFLVDGVHKNPRTVRLPPTTPIAAESQANFIASTRPLLEELEQRKASPQVALLDPTR